MKKIGLIVFIAALTIGSILSANCSLGSFSSNTRGVKGSGTTKTETRSVSGFNSVKVENAVNVEISAGNDFSVTVEADDNLLEFVKTEMSGDTLKIYSDGSISTKSEINVKISMPEINSLNVSGASTAVASNVKSDSLKLEASGASKIKIDGEAAHLGAEASGASSIYYVGEPKDIKQNSSGASSVKRK